VKNRVTLSKMRTSLFERQPKLAFGSFHPLLTILLCFCLSEKGNCENVLYEAKLLPYPIQVVLPVIVDGERLDLLFDTGADSHMLDRTRRSLVHKYIELRTLQGLGNDAEASFFEAPEMLLGGWRLPKGTMGLMDCSGFRRGLGFDVRGFLGIGSLKMVAIEFNFDEERVTFLSDFEPPKQGFVHQPLETSQNPSASGASKYDRLTAVQLELEGYKLDMTIDTGANTCVGLRHEIFDALVVSGAIKPKLDGSRVSRETATGSLQNNVGVLTRGMLFGVNLRDLPVEDAGAFDNVGMAFLVNLNFIIDVKNGQFYFQHRHSEPPIRQNRMFGAALTFIDGHPRILALAPGGGPAENAGIRVEDEILKIDGLPAAQINLITFYEMCLTNANKTVAVELSRSGESQSIKTKVKLTQKLFVYPPR
jgi:hypothetical protein